MEEGYILLDEEEFKSKIGIAYSSTYNVFLRLTPVKSSVIISGKYTHFEYGIALIIKGYKNSGGRIEEINFLT